MHIFTPDPDPPPEPVIYAVNDLLSDETWSAIEIATAGRLPRSPVLFRPSSADWKSQWEPWVNATFAERIAPALIRARQAASQGVLELRDLDREFGRDCPPEAREASQAHGRFILEANLGARHLPELDKMRRFVEEDRCPGHAVSILALRGSLFGVSLVNTLLAGLYSEWTAARTSPPRSSSTDQARASFAAMNPSLPRQLPAWLQSGGNNTFQANPGD